MFDKSCFINIALKNSHKMLSVIQMSKHPYASANATNRTTIKRVFSNRTIFYVLVLSIPLESKIPIPISVPIIGILSIPMI